MIQRITTALISVFIVLLFAFPALAVNYCFSTSSGSDVDTNDCTCTAGEWCKSIEQLNAIIDANRDTPGTGFYLLEGDTWTYQATKTNGHFKIGAGSEPSCGGGACEEDYIIFDARGNGDAANQRIHLGAFYDNAGTGTPIADDYNWNTNPSGYTRPKIDWDHISVDGPPRSAIDSERYTLSGSDNTEDATAYVTIANIEIANMNHPDCGRDNCRAIFIDRKNAVAPCTGCWKNYGTSYVTVRNMYVHHFYSNGILVYDGGCAGESAHGDNFNSHNSIKDNIIHDVMEAESGDCSFSGGTAIVCSHDCGGGYEVTGNLIYNIWGECIGFFHGGAKGDDPGWDHYANLVQDNTTYNCMSAHHHAGDQSLVIRWNLAGNMDDGRSGTPPTFYNKFWVRGTWPNCIDSNQGMAPLYGSPWTGNARSHYGIVENLYFGQVDQDNLGYKPVIAVSQSVGASPQDIQTSWVFGNTIIDGHTSLQCGDNVWDDGTESYLYFNAMAFFDNTYIDNNRRHCRPVWPSPGPLNCTWKYNFWEDSDDIIGSGCLDSSNDLYDVDIDIATTLVSGADAGWRLPADHTTVTWEDFAPIAGSPLIDPTQTAYESVVHDDDTGSGTTLYVTWPYAFWPGDYIAIGSRTDIAKIASIDYFVTCSASPTICGEITLESSPSPPARLDGETIHLAPYKWASKAQDTATGWYGTKADWGAIEYAGDNPPTLTAEPPDQPYTQDITLEITRSVLTGVSDAWDKTDWIVCTSSSLATCLGSTPPTSCPSVGSYIAWSSCDDVSTPASEVIPGDTLEPNETYYFTARTHNEWPYWGAWQSTMEEFSTAGDIPSGGDIALLITGTNNEIKFLVLDCEAEESTGLKVNSGATGNKIYNSTIVDCGTFGMDINANIEMKNTLAHNNAGPDIDYTGITVTAGNNNFEDSDPGGGTYNSATSDWSKTQVFYDFVTNNFKLRRTSDGVDAGTDTIYSGVETAINDKEATDASGDAISGAGIDVGAFESDPFLQHGPMSMGLGYGLN